MIDWQQYRDGVKLTPLRFHAQRNIARPGKPTEPFPIAETKGRGFLAGYNGQQVAMLDHAEEFETVKIPVTLKKGDNQLLIKTNNRQNRERHLWAIHCAVE